MRYFVAYTIKRVVGGMYDTGEGNKIKNRVIDMHPLKWQRVQEKEDEHTYVTIHFWSEIPDNIDDDGTER